MNRTRLRSSTAARQAATEDPPRAALAMPRRSPSAPFFCTGVPERFLELPSMVVGILSTIRKSLFLLVGTAGIEPARYFYQRILSPLRLPIPPRPRVAPPRIGWTNRIKVQ